MDIRAKIKSVLNEYYGDFSSNLETSYEYWIVENLSTKNHHEKLKLITYNQLILELKHNIKDKLALNELQYRITEELETKKVCIEVINKVKNRTPELERLYLKIINF